jgi:hypothetical protein
MINYSASFLFSNLLAACIIKKEKYAPYLIEKMTMNGALTFLFVASGVIRVAIGCRH